MPGEVDRDIERAAFLLDAASRTYYRPLSTTHRIIDMLASSSLTLSERTEWFTVLVKAVRDVRSAESSVLVIDDAYDRAALALAALAVGDDCIEGRCTCEAAA